jgi:hypothetical protein
MEKSRERLFERVLMLKKEDCCYGDPFSSSTNGAGIWSNRKESLVLTTIYCDIISEKQRGCCQMDIWGLIFASIIPLGFLYYYRREKKREDKYGVTSRTRSYSGKFLGPQTRYFKDGYRVYFSKNDKGEDCIKLYGTDIEYSEGIVELIKSQKIKSIRMLNETIENMKILEDDKVQFVGNTISKKYHDKKCEWAIKTNIHNKVRFNSAKEASDKGYKSCGVCLGNTNNR